MDYLKLIGLNPGIDLLKFMKDHALTIFAFLAICVGAVMFYQDYTSTKAGLAKANTDLALYQKKIDDQAAVIKNLQEKLELTAKSNALNNEAEVKIAEDEKMVDREQIQRQRAVVKKIIKVKEDPRLTDEEKEATASSIYVDDLWEGFCSRSENKSHAECLLLRSDQTGLTLKPTTDLPSIPSSSGE